MKTYVYLSKLRIDALYEQLGKDRKEEISSSLSGKFLGASANSEGKVTYVENTVSKLKSVLKRIKHKKTKNTFLHRLLCHGMQAIRLTLVVNQHFGLERLVLPKKRFIKKHIFY